MSMTEPTASVVADSRLRPLSEAEQRRYARNLLVHQVGVLGQQRIRAARVLVVGLGGLGSPAALYLAAAGVGTLGLVDPDRVEVSNLQRQVLHTTTEIGSPKTGSARASLAALNPDIELVVFPERLTSANVADLLPGWDVVVDGTDSLPTRYLLGEATAQLGIPLVHGAVLGTHGQVGVFDARQGPCFHCLHPVAPEPEMVPSAAQAGVLGALAGTVGSLQAMEVLKLVVGGASPLIGRMLVLDLWGARVNELAVAKSPACPVCGAGGVLNESGLRARESASYHG
ncbi:Probable adenylyltransferase/sulfurtransferase MoeZ [Actinomyces bovis]|uniref:Probable adenylyltransferase/sulfurtransferase MoeZ n=1 Tax=Actinomyces bovis TaxID=1658 RepID=A0ABY1VNT3_9ACTO|nr:molybdopterin-synthase adenylyltransferase MoeB [Actinomyces bovis]SPT53357.1 Probable adenylyltransferase/sulfurtransferase MoeZ [Actinomyces bovis]VEG52728.1 Probable adenylyltransferase/sulfurtransferase MoeZ [Actinomyces israelii]